MVAAEGRPLASRDRLQTLSVWIVSAFLLVVFGVQFSLSVIPQPQVITILAVSLAFVLQVTFSAATLILSASVAYQASHFLLGRSAVDSPVTLVILAGSLYLPLNTALIAAVVGLVDGRPVAHVARTCYEHVFPYFMGGIVFTGLVSGAFFSS